MARIFLVRRTRDNLSVTFGGRARRLGTHGLGTLEAISEREGKISIRNNEETERRGFDFWEVRNVSFFQWWTKEYNNERVLQARSRLADGVGGGHEVVVIGETHGTQGCFTQSPDHHHINDVKDILAQQMIWQTEMERWFYKIHLNGL